MYFKNIIKFLLVFVLCFFLVFLFYFRIKARLRVVTIEKGEIIEYLLGLVILIQMDTTEL
jgi:cytochrome c oxidase assembly factor CtaG